MTPTAIGNTAAIADAATQVPTEAVVAAGVHEEIESEDGPWKDITLALTDGVTIPHLHLMKNDRRRLINMKTLHTDTQNHGLIAPQVTKTRR